MAYTRWSDSSWYSFYQDNANNDTKDDQVLCLWHYTWSKDFTYKELCGITKERLKQYYPDASAKDIAEAEIIIETFKTAVEKSFAPDDFK